MANRFYLNVGDLEGPVTDPNHSNAMECTSISVGVHNSMNCVEKVQGNPGGEAHSHGPLTVTKVIDKLSPQLAVHCALGSGFDKAELQISEEGETLMTIKLEKVAIADYSVSASQEGVPFETITLNYALIGYQYKDNAMDHFNLAQDSSSLQKKAFSDSFAIS